MDWRHLSFSLRNMDFGNLGTLYLPVSRESTEKNVSSEPLLVSDASLTLAIQWVWTSSTPMRLGHISLLRCWTIPLLNAKLLDCYCCHGICPTNQLYCSLHPFDCFHWLICSRAMIETYSSRHLGLVLYHASSVLNLVLSTVVKLFRNVIQGYESVLKIHLRSDH